MDCDAIKSKTQQEIPNNAKVWKFNIGFPMKNSTENQVVFLGGRLFLFHLRSMSQIGCKTSNHFP